ncbi:sulfatase [Haloferula chungangensis]|uniref:Sulfatase n=1 Tax=Haloferula chungangensis TaxID=1048331 RepID=A0ABW2L691_9BACT
MILRLLALITVFLATRAGGKTNALFIICDDLNCHLACYGHPQVKTPNIDRLAERGLRFENAFCQFPVCGPSRASFMTGLYPDQTGILANKILLRDRLPTVLSLSQMFRNHGWHATRIGKIYHYGVPSDIGTAGHDDPASWDDTFNPRGRDKDDEEKIFSLKPGQFGATLSWLAAEGDDEEQTDGIAATEAVARLKQYQSNKEPFFLAIGLYRPHTPFVAPKKYFDLYPLQDIEIPSTPPGYLETLPPPARKALRAHKEQVDLDPKLARQAIQAYLASISYADAQIGRILDALDDTGLASNTIVIFTSDHGYHVGEHGHWQKRSLLDQGSRVPFIIAAPGMKTKGATTSCPAEMIDFYPTLAELCEIKPPAELPGVSLVPVLSQPAARPRLDALTKQDGGYSLRTERFRYTEWGKKGAGGNELYDHQSDPEELHNLAKDPAHAEIIENLAARLHQRITEAKTIPKGLKQTKGPAPLRH